MPYSLYPSMLASTILLLGLPAGLLATSCNIQGGQVCAGHLNNTLATTKDVANMAACQEICQSMLKCKFFQYDEAWQSCSLLSDCNSFIQCPSCWSGPPHPCARSSQAQPEVALLLAGLSNNSGHSGEFSRSVEVWPPSSDLTLPDIPLARYVAGAAILDAKVFLCGGLDDLETDNNALGSCSVLEDDNWKVGPSLAQKRADFSLNAVGDTLVAAGGYNDMGDGITSVELYREEKGAWEVAPWQLTSGRAGHCAATLNTTHLILYGGYGPKDLEAEMYNVKNGVVVPLPMIPGVSPEHGMACTVQDGSLIVSGGAGGGSDEFQASVNRLDLTTLTWDSLPSLNVAREFHTMGVVNGALVVFGGLGPDIEVPLDSMEILNGAVWEKQQLQTSRAAHAMAIMQFPSPPSPSPSPSPSGSWGLHQWSLQATALVVFFSMIITN